MLPLSTYRKQLTVLYFALFSLFFTATAQTNAIKEENALPGNPSTEWDIIGAGDMTLQGFATDISVNKGETVHFKIKSATNGYTIKIYRLGYYGGNGARFIDNGVITDTTASMNQPDPMEDPLVGLVDCGNWDTVAHWDAPVTAVSGLYIARLTRNDNSGASHIVFIVRDDASTADLLFQTSDATWQAYNSYGGNSLYVGGPLNGHAAKVSYNRPFITRGGGGGGGPNEDWLFNAEYPMIRFLEKNGYDVSYITNVDIARMSSNLILQHKVFLSVGHDEYWSKEQRDNVEAARDAGKHLAFFSGNEVYWKTRWENSIDPATTPYRTLVCYKEGNMGELVCGSKCDPTAAWTGLWRTPDGIIYDAGKAENQLSGQISWTAGLNAMKVPASYKNLRFWRNAPNVSALTTGQELAFFEGTLGYEWNWEQYFETYPAGRITMSSTTIGGKTHKLSLYRHASGALVFGAGTVQWAWGLDNIHDGNQENPSPDMQQATVNLLADMDVQPVSLQVDLTAATISTDLTAPHSIITFPVHSGSVPKGFPITITGTSSDAGGGVVGGIEVSVDAGATWLPATGLDNWTYTWTPVNPGIYFIKVRGVDDSGNLEAEGSPGDDNAIGVTVINNILFTATAPHNFQIQVALNAQVTATFDQDINGASVTSSTFQLKDAANNPVPATLSATTNTITLTPSFPLTTSSTYTVTIKGGASGIKSNSLTELLSDSSWIFTAVDPAPLDPSEGAGGPILVVGSTTNPFSRYASEILRAEGLNQFAAQDISAVNATMLADYDVVVLGEIPVTTLQATMFSDWVNAGGTLIAFRPADQLSSLLGITKVAGTVSDKYLLVNTSFGPGAGIVGQTIQYHGPSDQYSLNGATSMGILYSDAATATAYHAITTRSVGGNGGQVFAFSYDLARSIVYTRQGNPAWAGQDRDGEAPVRSDDMFFGSPDWIDFNKIAIPQADEQQRLLANMIIQGNLHRKPLPRFWYLPKGLKAAIVMTGDDHANNGTVGRFNKELTLGPNTPQDVADWNAVRSTSYTYTGTGMTNTQAIAFEAQGFEVALHPNTDCIDYTFSSLQNTFTTQLADFAIKFPGVSSPVSNRTHCLVWSDWASQAKAEALKGMRFDVNYYNWPEAWMQNRPGMFTGSGLPMRFADLDGTLIDCYQAPTQMTDETNMNYTAFSSAVLDKAIGPEGYYGVFTANMHTDVAEHTGSDQIIAQAQARNIPIVSAKQMLTWLDGRNNSTFGSINWAGNQLTFTITARSGARNLKTMLPKLSSSGGELTSITHNGNSLGFTIQTIKGMDYAFFDGLNGSYVVTYGTPVTGTLIGNVVLQGRPVAPNAQWVVPVIVEFYTTGNPIPVATYNATTDANGQFVIPNVAVGTYNIIVKNVHTLAKMAAGQTIALGNNTINFGALKEGDVNGDNFITLLDLSALAANFNKTVGDPGVNPNADLNNDGFITLNDMSILASNYNQSGDVNP